MNGTLMSVMFNELLSIEDLVKVFLAAHKHDQPSLFQHYTLSW